MMFCWTFYLSKNAKKKKSITVSKKILSSTTVFNIDKQYVEKLSSSFTEIIYILKYIQIVILDCNISQYYSFFFIK